MSEASRSLVEVVDFDGVFHSDFKTMFDELGLLGCGMEYNVVTVLGCQSSGKSTLLNALFGTKFPEMDSMSGRSQTTRGVWCSRDIESPTLVIDVEGTDSKERGEDRLTFEHRASLFSLAVADAVIVNMWYHDIGRYTASNYGLLKTVLAVMLELFHSSDREGSEASAKTHMIFVIRDHSPSLTPIQKLERSLLQDVVDIWEGIKKPLPLQSSTADDFFKFSVIGLPNKIDDEENFKTEVRSVKDNWLNQIRPKTYSRSIPADGFPMYCESVWNTIMGSDQLDIPSQKEMVAIYRCEEIKSRAFMKMKDGLSENRVLFGDVIDEGGEAVTEDNTVVQDLLALVVREYHKDAWRYDTSVYNRKLTELLDDCYIELQKIYDTSLNAERQKCLKQAAKQLEKLGRKDPYKSTRLLDGGDDVFDFWRQLDSKYLSVWMEETLGNFTKKCRASCIDFSVPLAVGDSVNTDGEAVKLHHEFTSDLQTSLLKENLVEMRTKFRESELQAFKNLLDEPVQGIREQIETLQLDQDLTNYWTQATNILLENSNRLYPQYGLALQGITGDTDGKIATNTTEASTATDSTADNTPVESGARGDKTQFNLILYECLRENFVRRSDRICDQVYKRFRRFFETDDEGVPNYWASTKPEDIKRIYREAKTKALALFPIICEYRIDLSALVDSGSLAEDAADNGQIDARLVEMSKQPLLYGAKQSDSLSTSEKFMLKACQEAQFIQATGGQMTRQSWWMWLLCLVLGWNEIMFIIRQPVFFMFGVTVSLVVSAAWYTGNLFTLITGGRLVTSHILGVILPIIQKELAPKPQVQAQRTRTPDTDADDTTTGDARPVSL